MNDLLALFVITFFLSTGSLGAQTVRNPYRIHTPQHPTSAFIANVNGGGVPNLSPLTAGTPTSPSATRSVDTASAASLATVNEQLLSEAPAASSQNEWTWMGGGSTGVNYSPRPGVYGTLGTPDAGNIPGGRADAVSWTDNSGNFWLFGGMGTDAIGSMGVLNDLWEFNSETIQWTWMGGSSTVGSNCALVSYCGQSGIYGTLYTFAAGNLPGGRSNAVKWTDSNGNLWLFGGYGYDANGDLGELNDLWKFNPAIRQWAWMGGSTTMHSKYRGMPGVYGVLGTPAPGNAPGGRTSAMSWVDSNGNFWLFGGVGFDSSGGFGDLNDLWKFDPPTNRWAWMGGSSTIGTICDHFNDCGYPGVYGALGTPASGNIPGSRLLAVTWVDSSGRVWLFGGTGFDAGGAWGPLNDLWAFFPSTSQWAWMGGSSTIRSNGFGQLGVYGTL